jgi:opacity protein-like surface antigen
MQGSMRATFLVAVVAIGLNAGVANAGTAQPALPTKAEPIAAAPDWNGLYLGFQYGMSFNSTKYDTDSTFVPGVFDTHTQIGDSSSAYGVYFGYNYQLPGPFVIGIEGDLTMSHGSFQLQGPASDFLQKFNGIDTIAGRFGFLVTPRTLLYGKVGASRIKLSGIEGFGTPFDTSVPATTFGIGIEGLVTDFVSLRLEATQTTATSDLVLNSNFDRYRPEVLQVMGGAAVKIDPLPHAASTQASWFPSPAAVNRSWTSVFVGGEGGAASGRVERTDPTFGQFGPFSDTGTIGGVFVGADWQVPTLVPWAPTFVIGVQYAYDWTSLQFADPTGNGLAAPIYQFASIDRVSAVTGRAGVLITPSTLAYFRGGPAWIRFTAEPDYFNAINPASGAGTSTMAATQLGMGVETFLTDHLALRVEGLFTHAHDEIALNGLAPDDTHLRPSIMSGTIGLLAKY